MACHAVLALLLLGHSTYKELSMKLMNRVKSSYDGGGQNQARAILTGALVGARVGLSGNPPCFIDGLHKRDTTLKLANSFSYRPA